MSIGIRQTDLGLPDGDLSSSSVVVVHALQIPLLVKIAICALLGSTLLTVGIMSLARTEAIMPIRTPPPEYLPGHLSPNLSTNISCHGYDGSMSCLARLSNQDVYFYSEGQGGREIIVRTTIGTHEYTIGALILAWGTPSGFDRYGSSIVVSWGTRSATLDTSSFQPTSPVGFITYDLLPLRRSSWQGFGKG